jgi:hypothetical protein
LQIRVLVLAKFLVQQSLALLAVAVFQIFVSRKSAHVFSSKSFVSNLLRLLKSASGFSIKVLAGKRFHFAKSIFCGLRFLGQSQASKIGVKVFSKSFGKFGSGFFARFIFSGKVAFS